jgi:RNA polymerase sigma factor (sigma-70 family)
VEGCQEAWAAVYAQYHRLVLSWVGGDADEAEDLAQRALEKFYAAVTPEVFTRFAADGYSGIGRVLAYLKRCARGVSIDRQRKKERDELALSKLRVVDPSYAVSLEQDALDRVHNEQFVADVYRRLRDDREKRVVYLSFELGYKPSEIASRFPAEFPSAHCVSRIKERIYRRLSNDPILVAAYGALQ